MSSEAFGAGASVAGTGSVAAVVTGAADANAGPGAIVVFDITSNCFCTSANNSSDALV